MLMKIKFIVLLTSFVKVKVQSITLGQGSGSYKKFWILGDPDIQHWLYLKKSDDVSVLN
jgi:hypothetical protein